MTQQGRLMNATQKEHEGIDDYIERFERLADSIDTEPQQKLTLFTHNTRKEIREDLITFGAGSIREAYNRARLKEASMMEREDKGTTEQVQEKMNDDPAEKTTIAAVNSYMEKNYPRGSNNNSERIPHTMSLTPSKENNSVNLGRTPT